MQECDQSGGGQAAAYGFPYGLSINGTLLQNLVCNLTFNASYSATNIRQCSPNCIGVVNHLVGFADDKVVAVWR